jgi:hypothetical protein
MNTNKSIFVSQHLIAIEMANIYNIEIKTKFLETSTNITCLPTPSTIYDKEIVISNKKTIIENRGYLYKTSKQSRFSFNGLDSSISTDDSVIEVPEFVCNILNRKLSKFSLFKNLDDTFLYSDTLLNFNENHPWAKFILAFKDKDESFLTKFNSA